MAVWVDERCTTHAPRTIDRPVNDRDPALRELPAQGVCVFDAERFTERGTTFEPNRLATGVRHVLVNGVHTLRDGELTGERAGQVLRRRA